MGDNRGAVDLGRDKVEVPSIGDPEMESPDGRRITHAAIFHGRRPIAEVVNATVIPLEQVAEGYTSFDHGAAQKFVLDPHGLLAA